MNAEKKRAYRCRLNAVGLTSKGTPIKPRGLSSNPEAVLRRARRAAAREMGLNSRGLPMVNRRTSQVLLGEAPPQVRDQRSWWLVTTSVPDACARLLDATGAWGATRFWDGDRLRPYATETGDSHEAA